MLPILGKDADIRNTLLLDGKKLPLRPCRILVYNYYEFLVFILISGKSKDKNNLREKYMRDSISIKGARVNNLKNIDLEIPRNKLVVFTGLSGSGKTSLAFDTLYAEGQRRYVESLSSYARQFWDRWKSRTWII